MFNLKDTHHFLPHYWTSISSEDLRLRIVRNLPEATNSGSGQLLPETTKAAVFGRG